ncbi:hypothetical protein DX888_03080 [Vibrio alginolyticus]|nr:hypothetical protein [Vibrio alginolyticus]
MKYRLGLRKITKGDMNRDCLLLPEPEDYEMYVTAMTEDINQLEIVEYALMDNSSIVIKLVVGFNIEHLKQATTSIQQKYWDVLRTTRFENIA